MTSMSVILAVLTSNINHRGLKGVQVPSCLRSVLTIMSKVMCMRLVFIKHKANNTVYQGMNPHARNPYHYISTTVSSGDSGCLTEYENGDANTQNMRHNSTHLNRQPSQKHDINQDVQLILQKLDLVLSKEEEKEHSELLIKQWVEVAEIIDRFFFWIFVIGTLFTSFFLLLVYPLFKGEAQIIQPSTWSIGKNNEIKIVNIFLPIIFSICFECSKEPSQWDGSVEYPQHMFRLRIKKNTL